jgi:hypothetical protein
MLLKLKIFFVWGRSNFLAFSKLSGMALGEALKFTTAS